MKVIGAVVVAVIALLPGLVSAHGGGVDKYGCHHDKKAGDYHCHKGELKGKSFKSQEEMLAAKKDAGGAKSDATDKGKSSTQKK